MLRAPRPGVVFTVALVACGGCNGLVSQKTRSDDSGIFVELAPRPKFFTDTSGCLAYLGKLDPRGPDVDHDFIPDGDADPSNDGLDQWGRAILDGETECSCTTCITESVACQKNAGCREIFVCALDTGCRSVRECYYGQGSPGSVAWPGGNGPCYSVIDKWGPQSVALALNDEIWKCVAQSHCPARKCPCESGDAQCPPRAAMTCAEPG